MNDVLHNYSLLTNQLCEKLTSRDFDIMHTHENVLRFIRLTRISIIGRKSVVSFSPFFMKDIWERAREKKREREAEGKKIRVKDLTVCPSTSVWAETGKSLPRRPLLPNGRCNRISFLRKPIKVSGSSWETLTYMLQVLVIPVLARAEHSGRPNSSFNAEPPCSRNSVLRDEATFAY